MEQLSPETYTITPYKETNINPDDIIKKVALAYNVDIDELQIRRRFRKLVEPRQVIFYLLRRNGLIYEKIADLFGCTHATVIYHYRRVITLLQTDKYFRQRTEGLL